MGERGHDFAEPFVGFFEERRGLGVAVVGDDDPAGIDVGGVQAEVFKRQGDDVAGEAFSVGGDGVYGARREFAQDGDTFDQFGEFIEEIVEGAVQVGAVFERHDEAGFAGMEVAEFVKLADVVVTTAFYRGLRDGEELVGGLAHGGDYDYGLAVGAGFDYGRDAFDGCG